MSDMALIDTSVFCPLLRVPRMDQEHEEAMEQFQASIEARTSLLLPIATIIETGNHLAHCGTGRQRRRVAEEILRQAVDSLKGQAPWVATPLFDRARLTGLLPRFPDEAMRGVGMGDLTILAEWERQCKLSRHRRVYIWSLDRRHLSAYDRRP